MTHAHPWDEIAFEVVSDILENTAFTEVTPVATEPNYGLDARGVSLLVHDPVQGEFQLFMEKALLHQLTATVYGPVLGEVTEQLEEDFLAELLNTIAGRFLGGILPPEKSFRLGLPEQVSGTFSCPAQPCLGWTFVVDGNMYFSLSINGESLVGSGEQGA